MLWMRTVEKTTIGCGKSLLIVFFGLKTISASKQYVYVRNLRPEKIIKLWLITINVQIVNSPPFPCKVYRIGSRFSSSFSSVQSKRLNVLNIGNVMDKRPVDNATSRDAVRSGFSLGSLSSMLSHQKWWFQKWCISKPNRDRRGIPSRRQLISNRVGCIFGLPLPPIPFILALCKRACCTLVFSATHGHTSPGPWVLVRRQYMDPVQGECRAFGENRYKYTSFNPLCNSRFYVRVLELLFGGDRQFYDRKTPVRL